MIAALFNPETLIDTLLFVCACISVIGYLGLVWRIRGRDRTLETNLLGFPDLLVSIVLCTLFANQAMVLASMHNKAATPLKAEQVLPGSLVLLLIVGGIVGFLKYRRISLLALLGLRQTPVWKAILLGVGLLLLAMPMLMWVSALIADHLPKELSDEQQLVQLFQREAQKGQYRGVITILVAAIFLAPPMEEFLFRGYFYTTFKRYVGRVGSAFLTAAIFAMLHANLASAGGLFLLALCLTAAYEWSGSLLVPMTMHATFNAMSLVELYLNAQPKL